jgi:hypothetical protein
MHTPGREIGGEVVYVGDCHVWAAIYYLDSPTNYREWLPQHCPLPRSININDDLDMLNSSRNLTSPQADLSSFSVLLISVMLIVLFDFLLLQFVDHL